MQIFPAAYKNINDRLAKAPVYVFEIIWAAGGHGTEGTNDIYFTTCDVNDILNFPYPARWFPFLDAESISGISQSVDPINGVSTIGQLSVSITDYGGMVSDIIKAADTAGHGLRRQLCEVYQLYKGMDWADKVKVRTMHVQDLRLANYNQYKLTCEDVQALLRKTIFNTYSTTLTAAITGTGAITAAVLNAHDLIAATSVDYGTVGFVKIDDEIIRWTAKTDTALTVGASDRGLFGTIAATHAIDAKVGEVIVLNENPITMALKIMTSSGVAGVNGAWDAYPARWGCNMNSNDVDVAGILEVGKLLVGLSDAPAASNGMRFEFVIDQGIEAKQFIEDSIFKILGCYGFVRADGKYSIRAYSDLANANKQNADVVLDQNAVIEWGELKYNYTELANQLWIEYDETVKLSGKYLRQALFIDSVSIKKWGEAKQLKYQAPGIMPTTVSTSQLYQRFQRVMSRYSRPPMQIELTLLPRYHGVEIGDIARIMLPIRDLLTGLTLDRAFEVISVALKPKSGDVSVCCIAQPEVGAMWFGGVGAVASVVVSPAIASINTGSTLQMVAVAYDGAGSQVPIPVITWMATGNVTVDGSGLVTAGAAGNGVVYAVVGATRSNDAAITVTTANNNPVASVSVVPSSIKLAPGETQQLTALAYDITGAMINGVTFNWASSNAGVATLPVGVGTTKILTAVANGTSNITATETVSGIVSPICVATVETPPTQTYFPPTLADSAYQIGTKITTHGPVGGPHIIPNGYNFASGDYWYDGDVSISSGSTCTINGTVRIFSLGTITISGTIDGAGRGGAGAFQPAASVGTTPYPGLAGVSSTPKGFLGHGGIGGSAIVSYSGSWGGAGGYAWSDYSAAPTITVIGVADAGGNLTSISGLPTKLMGSGGGSGAQACGHTTCVALGGAGGNGGAGLLLCGRGLYVVTGVINLNGLPGGNGSVTAPGVAGAGAGGGGGTFVGLVEPNAYGIETNQVITTRINVSAGAFGNGAINSPSINIKYTQLYQDYTNQNLIYPASPGAIYRQVIG